MAAPRPATGVPSSRPSSPTAGLDLAPFRGVRYAAADEVRLADLTCPPYDVIDERQQEALEAADPHNIVRLILPRGDGSDPASGYRRAASTLRDWLADGTLVADEAPALYAYEMRDAASTVRGVIGALALRDPADGVVLPHEDVMPGPVEQRRGLIAATGATIEPIYLVADGPPGATAELLAAVAGRTPAMSVRAGDGSEHRLWPIRDGAEIAAVTADLSGRRALIADGHHRYAAYRLHQAEEQAAGAGAGPWDRGLALIVDQTTFGAHIQAFHRVVYGLDLDTALAGVTGAFTVTELAGNGAADAADGAPYGADGRAGSAPLRAALARLTDAGRDGTAFVLTDGHRWLLLTDPSPDLLVEAVPADRSAAWRGLDVVLLHHAVLDACWHVQVTEETVRYVADPTAAIELARTRSGVAVLMNPTPLRTVLDVAAAAERMPQKSTLFAPKPRTGMVFRLYDEAAASTA